MQRVHANARLRSRPPIECHNPLRLGASLVLPQNLSGLDPPVVFGFLNGVAVVAPQRPVRGQGGFVQLGFPLSRIFNADPKGCNVGWTAYLYYGDDQANARDSRRFGGRGTRSDLFSGQHSVQIESVGDVRLRAGLLSNPCKQSCRPVAVVSRHSQLYHT